MSSQAIQEQMLVPRPFLIRIIADLSRAGLVMTFPGPNGGLELARPAGEINLRQIWEAIEGPLAISDCLAAPQDCALSSGCPVRCRWERLQNLMLAELESITMEELAAGALRIEAVKKSGKLQSRALVGAEVY
jgi:Rrf2 family protein